MYGYQNKRKSNDSGRTYSVEDTYNSGIKTYHFHVGVQTALNRKVYWYFLPKLRGPAQNLEALGD